LFIDLEPGAVRFRERIAHVPDETLHEPHLFDVEVLHALRDLALTGLSPRTAAGTP
jgi:predicted nucleic acid-binding protein